MPIMTMLEMSRPSGGEGHSPQRVAGQHDLAQDLGRREIAHQALGPGMAEAAGQRAADLGGDAERAAILLRDMDRLGLLAVGESQQPFARAVDRLPVDHGAGPRDDIALGQIGAEALGQRGHQGEIGGAAMIDPMPELAGAEGRFADPGELGLELRPVEPDQLDSAIGGRGRRGEDIRMAGRAHDLPTGPCRRRRSPDRPWRSRAGNRYR